jgi:hypothetical protein
VSDQKSNTRHMQKIFDLLWRSVAVGAGYLVVSQVGNFVARLSRMPSLSLWNPIALDWSLLTVFGSGVLFGLTLGPLASRLQMRALSRIGILFTTLFVLNALINNIEGFFFTTLTAGEWASSMLSSAVNHAGLAVLVALIFRPSSANRGLPEILREILGRRGWLDWLWRFILAGLIYIPVYFFFGMIVFPFVKPYYLNQALGLRLTIPGLDVILPLEAVRGLIYALTLFPLIAVLRANSSRSRYRLAFWVMLALAVLGSWQPMLIATFWPPALRLAHGLEITGDSIVYGLIVVWLMVPGRKKPEGKSDELAG